MKLFFDSTFLKILNLYPDRKGIPQECSLILYFLLESENLVVYTSIVNNKTNSETFTRSYSFKKTKEVYGLDLINSDPKEVDESRFLFSLNLDILNTLIKSTKEITFKVSEDSIEIENEGLVFDKKDKSSFHILSENKSSSKVLNTKPDVIKNLASINLLNHEFVGQNLLNFKNKIIIKKEDSELVKKTFQKIRKDVFLKAANGH